MDGLNGHTIPLLRHFCAQRKYSQIYEVTGKGLIVARMTDTPSSGAF